MLDDYFYEIIATYKHNGVSSIKNNNNSVQFSSDHFSSFAFHLRADWRAKRSIKNLL